LRSGTVTREIGQKRADIVVTLAKTNQIGEIHIRARVREEGSGKAFSILKETFLVTKK